MIEKFFGAAAAFAVLAVLVACGSDSETSNNSNQGINDAGIGTEDATSQLVDGSDATLGPSKPTIYFRTPPDPCVDDKCPDGGTCSGFYDDGAFGRSHVCVFDEPCNHLLCPNNGVCGYSGAVDIKIAECYGPPEQPQDASSTIQ